MTTTIAEVNWNLRGRAMFALWHVGKRDWDERQQEFIDERVIDIFSAGYSAACQFTRGCKGYTITVGYKTQGGLPYARRMCAFCGIYLEPIR